MTSLASHIKFSELCEVLESIKKAKQPKERRIILSGFIKNFKSKPTTMEDKNLNDISFYSVLRLILPQSDRARGSYGVKEITFAKKIIKMLSLPPNGSDATCLLNFQISKSNKIKDFADAAFWVLQKHFYKSSNLSIDEVNEYLNALTEKHSSSDSRGFDELLFKLFRATPASEQKWLIRMILKDVQLGMGHDTILNTFHPDASELYSTNNDLKNVCETLKDNLVRLNEIEISTFKAFRPMLSQRCDLKEFKKVTSSENIKYYVETKFDGERFQLHMKDGVFKYFSRNGFDYTHTFGESCDSGIYTPLLKTAFKNVNSIILDGEMMGWNTVTKKFGSKGMNFDVKNLKDSSTHQPCLCVFDILLLNDEVITNKPLKQRIQCLQNSIAPIEGVIVISKIKEAISQKEIIDYLNKAMDNKEEGIVFKDPNSPYKVSTRNAGWWKMKLEYFEGVMNDLDLLILGGYYGKGRHRLNVHDFLVGVVKAVPDGESPKTFLSFAKVQSGLSNEEYAVLDNKLAPFWRSMKDGDPKQYGLNFGKEKPEVWIPPENSCVLLVRATELIRIHSGDFQTDYTLRFPRIQQVRYDKPHYDCLTDTELEGLTSQSKSIQKLNKRHLELSDLEDLTKKKKKVAVLKSKNFDNIEVRNNILNGYEFRILTGNDSYSKEQVETLIVENGGTVVQNQGNDTSCLLAGHYHPLITLYSQSDNDCDVVKLEWLFRVIEEGKFINYEPFDLMCATKKRKLKMLAEYDQYFDSYTEEASEESIRKSIAEIKKKGHYINLMPEEINQLLSELKSVKKVG